MYIYIDGSSIKNPGFGGYAIILKYKIYRRVIFQGYRITTNNRMELLSIVIALESLKRKKLLIIIYSDSKYLIDIVEKKWIKFWFNIFFKNKKNLDLWKRFWIVYNKNKIKFFWIKSHIGHLENEICNNLAIENARNNSLCIDYFFEKY